MNRQIEVTQEIHEGSPVLKVTFFYDGRDINMLRFDSVTTMLAAIRQFYAPAVSRLLRS